MSLAVTFIYNTECMSSIQVLHGITAIPNLYVYEVYSWFCNMNVLRGITALPI